MRTEDRNISHMRENENSAEPMIVTTDTAGGASYDDNSTAITPMPPMPTKTVDPRHSSPKR